MVTKIIEKDGYKITITDMTQEEFLELHPDAITIETKEDLQKLELRRKQQDKENEK